VRLSGGQKQRTALARALIKNPPILILDDAFSSVDVQTEESILGELRAVMAGRTTILISHRISTVKNADQIVVLKEGRIVERGRTRSSWPRRAYHRLYQKQLLARELEALARRRRADARHHVHIDDEVLGKVYDTRQVLRLLGILGLLGPGLLRFRLSGGLHRRPASGPVSRQDRLDRYISQETWPG